MFRLSPPRIVALSFLGVILLGTFILSLPVSVRPGENIAFIDALFSATSASCVTGLVVVDTGSFFSNFGHFVILGLIQVGGLGIMTLSTVFAVMLGKKLTLKQGLVIESTVGKEKEKGIKTLLKYIVVLTLLLEMAGALVLFLVGFDIKSAVFHAVAAFCNAGFSLYPDNLMAYQGDIMVNLVIMALIIAGGLGFVVLLELPKLRFCLASGRNPSARLTLQAQIALWVSLALVVLGVGAIFVIEKNGALSGVPLKNKICASFFQSVTARTAGFNTLDIGRLSIASELVLVFLMFIGASPGSTGGGIKTVTFGVLLASFRAMMRNRPYASLFGRRIPQEVLNKALVIFGLGLLWIFIVSLILSITESGLGHEPDVFVKVLFETTSAFGTVGLSTGITPGLTVLGKILIIITMFIGRVGPLTLALAIALRQQMSLFRYPEEKVMVG